MNIQWDRGLRIVIAPFLIVAMLIWADYLASTTSSASGQTNTASQDKSESDKSVLASKLKNLPELLTAVIVVGFVISSVSVAFLRCLRKLGDWKTRIGWDYELPFTKEDMAEVERHVFEITREDSSDIDLDDYADRLALLVFFQRVKLNDGVLRWMDRRWTTVGTYINGLFGLIVGGVLTWRNYNDIVMTCTWMCGLWWSIVAVVGISMLVNAWCTRRELERMNRLCFEYAKSKPTLFGSQPVVDS